MDEFLSGYEHYWRFAGGRGPGPGVANVHVGTAKDTEEYFATFYLNQHLLDPPPDLYARLADLLHDDTNVHYTAAILRRLADLRKGKKGEPLNRPHLHDLDEVDMQIIYGAFRAGIRPWGEGYDSIDHFQRAVSPGKYGWQIPLSWSGTACSGQSSLSRGRKIESMRPNNLSINSQDATLMPDRRLMALLTAFIVTALTALTLSCSSSVMQAKRKVERVFAALQHPPQAVLVERVSNVGGGSDPKCWAAFTVALYGTSQSFEDVLTFYTLNLPSQGWQVDETPGYFQLSDGTSFQLLSERDAWASLSIPNETRKKSQKQFNTIFFITIGYSNPESRAYCRQW